MSFYPELDNVSLHALLRLFGESAPDGAEYAASYYEEVATEISQHRPEGLDWLLNALGYSPYPDEDGVRTRAILLAVTQTHLTGGDRFRVEYLLLHYLRDLRPLVVAEAIDGLWRQNIRLEPAEVLALQGDASPDIRASALRYLSHIYPDEARQRLLLALDDKDPIVRETAIDELDWLGEAEAAPSISSLLEDPNPAVREAAETAVANLAS